MAQNIRNIKAGQKFLVIDENEIGFKKGTIVEALESINNIGENYWFICKWIGGTEFYKDIILGQSTKHLKRFKGKINRTSNN